MTFRWYKLKGNHGTVFLLFAALKPTLVTQDGRVLR